MKQLKDRGIMAPREAAPNCAGVDEVKALSKGAPKGECPKAGTRMRTSGG